MPEFTFLGQLSL